MLNSALSDYKSKHLHTTRGGSGSSRTARGDSFRGGSSRGSSSRGGSSHKAGSRGGGSWRGNGRGGHQGPFKDRSFKKSYKNHKSVGFKYNAHQDGAHAANLALPPPPPYHTAPEQHFALVVPDASRTLFSISQTLIGGHHVHFGTSPGLLLHHTKAFIPFVRDSHTGMYLLPLIPPNLRHNGTYPLQQAIRAAVPAISINPAPEILPAIPITQYMPPDIILHNTLGHISHRRGKQLDVGLPQPSGKAC